MRQLSTTPQGGARVFADSKPLFEKSGWKNGLIFNELKISSLEWLTYPKKIAALRRLNLARRRFFCHYGAKSGEYLCLKFILL